MKLFKYLDDKKSLAETYRIYKAVQDLKPYAISKYKSWWEDALDEAFFHILENYDSSKGDLENYATRVVGTIFLNRTRKEVASNETTLLTLDLQEADNFDVPEEVSHDDNKSSDLSQCIFDTIPYFVKDFKFFVSSNTKDRRLNYSKLVNKYTYYTINSAKEFLLGKYSDDILRLVQISKSIPLKSFSDDRYLKSTDSGLTYKGSLNGIAIVERCKGSHSKKIYRLDIKNLKDLLVDLFYDVDGCGRVSVEGIDVYVSISGNIVVGKDSLMSTLESELVGSVLSRTSLKVVNYLKGDELLLSSTRDNQGDISIPMFGKDIIVGFDRVVSKEVF